MYIDEKIISAIQKAVEKAGNPYRLSLKLAVIQNFFAPIHQSFRIKFFLGLALTAVCFVCFQGSEY